MAFLKTLNASLWVNKADVTSVSTFQNPDTSWSVVVQPANTLEGNWPTEADAIAAIEQFFHLVSLQ